MPGYIPGTQRKRRHASASAKNDRSRSEFARGQRGPWYWHFHVRRPLQRMVTYNHNKLLDINIGIVRIMKERITHKVVEDGWGQALLPRGTSVRIP